MARFTVKQGALRALVHGRPGQRELIRRADAVVARAKIFSPVDTGNLRGSIRRGPPRPSGPHRASITVGADARYAAAIHEGRGSRYAPRSWSRRGPGPRRFLTNALSAAGGRVIRRGR